MNKRLVRKSQDNTEPEIIIQQAPPGYKDFEDFINNATDEEIEQYMEANEAETVDNFRDDMYW